MSATQSKRMLVVIHFPVFGGPHNEALRLHGPLSQAGWRQLVVLPERASASRRLCAAGVEVTEMPLHRLRTTPDPRIQLAYPANVVGDVQRLARVIRAFRPHVVQVAGLVNPQAAVAARACGVPVLWKITDSRTPRMLRRATMPLVRMLADAVMFNGKALEDEHVGRRPLSRPSTVYYPPVDLDQFRPSAERRTAARAALGIGDGISVVGMVANLNPQKGIEHFVAAAAHLHRRRPGTLFLCVGARYETHGRYLRGIERAIDSSGVPRERFLFTGERDDVEYLYPAMDVKVVTSVRRSEGSTTTLLEAMACGVPVVATDVGAIREVVQPGETGVLVPPEEPAAIAGALDGLLGDRPRATAMGMRGRARAEERFSIRHCLDAHLTALDAAAGTA